MWCKKVVKETRANMIIPETVFDILTVIYYTVIIKIVVIRKLPLLQQVHSDTLERKTHMSMIEAAEREQLLRIYAETRTIAVVGASADASKAAHHIPRYLQSQGYRILPVNPRGGELFGERVFRSLAEIDMPVDVVDVFRPTQEAPEIARQAIVIGAKVLWLQVGLVSEEARHIAEAAGLTVVMNRCMGETHGQLGLGPGPDAPTDS
jgi:predicted CoA-binding protein